jgi:hypothetical protein
MAEETQGGKAGGSGIAGAEVGASSEARPRSGGLGKAWDWFTTTRYTRALEAEAARLRADNNALMTLLAGAGHVAQVPAGAQAGSPQGSETGGSASSVKPVPAARRRSWQQIGRMLELEVSRMLAQKRGGVGVRPAQEAFSEGNGLPSDASGGGEKSQSLRATEEKS